MPDENMALQNQAQMQQQIQTSTYKDDSELLFKNRSASMMLEPLEPLTSKSKEMAEERLDLPMNILLSHLKSEGIHSKNLDSEAIS